MGVVEGNAALKREVVRVGLMGDSQREFRNWGEWLEKNKDFRGIRLIRAIRVKNRLPQASYQNEQGQVTS